MSADQKPNDTSAESEAAEQESPAGEGETAAESEAGASESEGQAPDEEPEDAARDSDEAQQEPKTSAAEELQKLKGAKWADGIAGFEQRWTWFEARLLTFVLIWQLASLVLWVLLSGLASPPSAGDSAGAVFRCTLFAVVLGVAAHFALKRFSNAPDEKKQYAIIGSIFAGIFIGLVLRPPADATGGLRLAINKALALDRADAAIVQFFSNVKSWLQDGSTLTLMGGLRGLATRLTLWLALLGASLATAAGKHIHIDVIFRFLPKRFRVPAAIVNFSAAAMVCFAATWGFFDHIAIESFGAKAEDTAGQKISRSLHEIGKHAFLTRKQIGLDLRTLPHVLQGERYDRWMSPALWNDWVSSAGFEEHFKKEEIQSVIVPADSDPHTPLVISPDGEGSRGMLTHDLGLVFPFGLLMIGIRFLLRAILTLSGHIPADPDAAHKLEGQADSENETPAQEGAKA